MEGVRGYTYELIAELAMHRGLHQARHRLEDPSRLEEAGLVTCKTALKQKDIKLGDATENALQRHMIGLATLT